MRILWFRKKKVTARRKKRCVSKSSLHYQTHKEFARTIVLERLAHWNQFYGHNFNRVAIRNQRSRWGSCSTKKNLNFNYRLIFIPEHLMDYVIVHELCHLKHFNHSTSFWTAVAEQIPDYEARKRELHYISKNIKQHVIVGVRPLRYAGISTKTNVK